LPPAKRRSTPSPKQTPSKLRRGRRLAAADREQEILAGAIRYFAEVGFGGQTRQLAERLGITQPLLYRYFPTKKHLIDRVFSEMFLKRVEPGWGELIQDRSRPLEDRLVDFYQRYSRSTYAYEWIRIYMFSALMGNSINRRYIKIVEARILQPICAELRHACGLPGPEAVPISELELEHVWVMHGGLFYYAVRKYIYHSRVGGDFAAVVRRSVAAMIAGIGALGLPSGAAR
jgi:AcrR family transcriptional regulator